MTRQLLVEAAQRLFADNSDAMEQPTPLEQQRLWLAVSEAGISQALHPVMAGQFSLADATALAGPAAYYAMPIPLAETLIAQWLLMGTAAEVPTTPMTFATSVMHAEKVAGGGRVRGTISRIPWLRQASHVVVPLKVGDAYRIGVIAVDQQAIRQGHNLAGEPRDDLKLDVDVDVHYPVHMDFSQILSVAAAFRSVQIAGALNRVLDLTLMYVQDRIQFGKPLSKLQAVQQLCAVLAGHAAVATAAADLALEALDSGIDQQRIAAAKIRCGEAAGAAASIAHQLHGAMGITREHCLHRLTRRLWSWRDEYGNEAYWAQWLGNSVAAASADALWPLIAAT